MDTIIIKRYNELFLRDSVAIWGSIKNPGKYPYYDGLSLKDLIMLAGGFKKDADIAYAEIARIHGVNQTMDSLSKIIYVPIDSIYGIGGISIDDHFLLKPNDNVYIRKNANFEETKTVEIRGEVMHPGFYPLRSKFEKLSEAIARAGGVKKSAFLEGAKFFRKFDGEYKQIGIDMSKALSCENCDQNIILSDGDLVIIPERKFTVRVEGAVNFPNNVLFQKGKKLEYYINAAGGFREDADSKKIVIQLANGRIIMAKKNWPFGFPTVKITPGSTLFVPKKKYRKEYNLSEAIRDVAAMLTSVATILILIGRIN
jgi:protein involved in polysaccharide export with SLBB domain